MKKLYAMKSFAVAAFAIMANVAMGQNLKVTSNGNPVADGDVIDLPYELVVNDFPEMGLTFYSAKWDPHLEASTASGTAPLTVTLTSVDDTNGFQLCWPGGCQFARPNESVTSSGTIDATPQDLSIHKAQNLTSAEDVPSEGGKISVEILSGSESVTVTVNAILQVDNAVGENIADINSPTVYYTLQGVRVENPGKGIYVARKGGKARLIRK